LTFDTANGFAGVWHLGEQSNSLVGEYKDATFHAYNLTGATRTASLETEGMIGRAQHFDTVAADSIAGSCPAALSGNASFTASFWVKIKFTQNQLVRVCLTLALIPILPARIFLSGPILPHNSACLIQERLRRPAVRNRRIKTSFSVQSYSGTWMLVAMVYDAALGTLSSYVNGTLMDKDTMSAIQINVNGGLHIGRPYADYYPGYFSGDIDEVRILSVAESQDWISLCYMNQRSDDKLVVCK
jgi:hypothetical protein